MKFQHSLASLLTIPLLAAAQNVTVPPTCTNGTSQANDVVLYMIPYPYASVMSIIGSYQNLTWSGSPDGSVTLNGSDNTVGTARTYDLAGAHVIETILNYSKPANGPYYENHNVAPLSVATPGGNVSLYCQVDATTVTSMCGGMATLMNFTAQCCSNNATVASGLLHMLHSGDAMTVQKFLGGGANLTVGMCPSNSTGPAPYAGGAVEINSQLGLVGMVLGWLLLL